ncbi:MAG: hypothetical protein HXY40_15155 [Chloroflexi bacterium]|nr:hypothetical protein [Chloroflexota bacterium]
MSRANVLAFVAVLVFAVLLVAFVAVGLQQGWAIFQRPERGVSFNSAVLNENAILDGAVDLAGVDVDIALIPPSSGEESRTLTLELTAMQTYLRAGDPAWQGQMLNVCIYEISFGLDATDSSTFYFFIGDDFRDDIPECLPVEINGQTSSYTFGDVEVNDLYSVRWEFTDKRIVINNPDFISLNFWYPYDSFRITPVMQVAYAVYAENGDGDFLIFDTLTPYLAWEYRTSGARLWDINMETTTQEYNGDGSLYLYDGQYEQITLEMQRPLLYRVILPFFVVMMVLLIGMVPLLSDRDTLVDICAAMLFGIFGLKGILGPAEAMGQTILDISLIGLYIVLAFAAFLFFMGKIRARGKETA